MKNRYLGLLLAFTILLSGAAGFGGAYVMGILNNGAPESYQEMPPYSVSSVPVLDKSQTAAPSDYYFASLDEYPEETAELSLLNADAAEPAREELTIPQIAAAASNTVVEIYTESVSRSGRMGQFVTEGAGSGVIISPDGYIVTNNHVIEGSRKITVRLSNGMDFDATLVGRDSKTDLAVLRINATGLKSATMGDSDRLVVGQLAVAIGNPLGKLGGTVSEGIISALSRKIEIDGHTMDLLQTTAAVNPGNSGGGLFNAYGELVGIVNASRAAPTSRGSGSRSR